jgi:hypothetical protein
MAQSGQVVSAMAVSVVYLWIIRPLADEFALNAISSLGWIFEHFWYNSYL